MPHNPDERDPVTGRPFPNRTAKYLHAHDSNTPISEAEIILLNAYHDIRAAEASPEAFRRLSAWEQIRMTTDYLLDGDTDGAKAFTSGEPKLLEAATVIAKWISEYREAEEETNAR